MIAIVSRVKCAKLTVDNRKVSEIEHGLLVYLGVEVSDQKADADYLVKKIAALRIFADQSNKMNLSVADAGGEIMIVSNFTLCGDTSRGNRPDFFKAKPPLEANGLYEYFTDQMRKQISTKTGVFGADMQIESVADGPVNIIINSTQDKK